MENFNVVKKNVYDQFILSYFLWKKYLLVGASGVCYKRVNGWVSRWEICHTNRIGSTINSQLNFLFLLQVNVTRYFYFLVSNGNLIRVVAIKTDESVTLVHLARIKKQEANLAACLDLSFLNVFSSILISCLNGNS